MAGYENNPNPNNSLDLDTNPFNDLLGIPGLQFTIPTGLDFETQTKLDEIAKLLLSTCMSNNNTATPSSLATVPPGQVLSNDDFNDDFNDNDNFNAQDDGSDTGHQSKKRPLSVPVSPHRPEKAQRRGQLPTCDDDDNGNENPPTHRIDFKNQLLSSKSKSKRHTYGRRN